MGILSTSELHSRRESLKHRLIEYQNNYIDIKSGLIKSDLTINRCCPVCDSNSSSKDLFVKNGAIHAYCFNCSIIYTTNILKDKEQHKYYQNLPHLQDVFAQQEGDFYEKQYDEGIDQILMNMKSHNSDNKKISLLDYGCSSGVFLTRARLSNRFSSHGFEINKSDINISREKGFTIIDKMSELKSIYDVITLWDVFEHIADPYKFLTDISSFLTPNGLIFMQIPTCQALAPRIMRENCNIFDGLEHLNLYSLKSIEIIASKLNLDIISTSSVIDELWPIENYLNYLDPYVPEKSTTLPSANIFSSDLVITGQLGYKLRIILRKN